MIEIQGEPVVLARTSRFGAEIAEAATGASFRVMAGLVPAIHDLR
jgi:hypothetical protein